MNDSPQSIRSKQSYDWREAPFVHEVESYMPLTDGLRSGKGYVIWVDTTF